MFEILNGKEVSCDNRFLEHKTIYKLEGQKMIELLSPAGDEEKNACSL